MLALIATPIAALGLDLPPASLWVLVSLCGAHMLALALIPARRLPRWAQLLYLAAQCALVAAAQTVAPAAVLAYVYLAIVLQAILLFPLWLWIPFAVGVYAVWSGLLAFATANFFAWLQSNLALAFPATCAIISAIVYVRQQRRSEQVQQKLQQAQGRYDQLTTGLRDLQQLVAIEERRRLAQTLVSEVQAALSRTDQSVMAALAQAQTNLGRLQSTVAQTRDAAATTVERLRGMIATLRRGDPADQPAGVPLATALMPADEAVLTVRSANVLTWVLPSVFAALAIGLTMVQHGFSPQILLQLLLCSVLLLLAYVCTQQTRHSLLLQAGLIGQAMVVLAMTAITHTLPLLLGLLLVLWQLAMRLPLRQVLVYVAAMLVAALAVWRSGDHTGSVEALLVGAVAAMAVGGPLVLARRQLERRRQAELRLALLSAEIDQQTAEVRTLAVAAERSRLAREVHDDLGSRLMVIALQLQLAEELAAEDAGAALEQLQSSREQLRAAWQSVLTVADAELTLGCCDLPAALGELATQTGPPATLTIDGDLSELVAPVRAAVYRTVQEGLTNARKHARASGVEVQVRVNGGYVTISVTNDGVGDDVEAVDPARTSYGLIGLRERAEAVGGGIEAGLTANRSWRLRAVLPVEGA